MALRTSDHAWCNPSPSCRTARRQYQADCRCCEDATLLLPLFPSITLPRSNDSFRALLLQGLPEEGATPRMASVVQTARCSKSAKVIAARAFIQRLFLFLPRVSLNELYRALHLDFCQVPWPVSVSTASVRTPAGRIFRKALERYASRIEALGRICSLFLSRGIFELFCAPARHGFYDVGIGSSIPRPSHKRVAGRKTTCPDTSSRDVEASRSPSWSQMR